VYGDIYDGLRSYYACFPTRAGSAAYSAAMSLSFICCINVGSLLVIADLIVTGNQEFSIWFFGNKLLLIMIGISIAWLHVFLGKKAGIYYLSGPARCLGWKRYLVLYSAVSALMFLASVTLAIRNHLHA
jgi:hypothetical protein